MQERSHAISGEAAAERVRPARAAYRERRIELRVELAEAERRHDLGGRERLQEEREWIERALGLSGPTLSARLAPLVQRRLG